MSRLFNLLIMLVTVALALILGSLNRVSVAFDFFFVQSEAPLGVLLLTFLLAGMLLAGALVYINLWLTLRRKLRQVRKQQAAQADKLDKADETAIRVRSDS